MNLTDYQKFTATVNHCGDHQQRLHLFCGLAAEAGEVNGVMQKFARDVLSGNLTQPELAAKYSVFLEDMTAELGDVLWYVSELATHFSLDLQNIVDHNVRKLKKRKQLRLV